MSHQLSAKDIYNSLCDLEDEAAVLHEAMEEWDALMEEANGCFNEEELGDYYEQAQKQLDGVEDDIEAHEEALISMGVDLDSPKFG